MGLFSSLSSSSSRHGSSRKHSSDQGSSAPASTASAAPPVVTGVQAEPQLMENYITWEPVSWNVVLDHYRVIGTDPNGVDVLLGKTIFPFFHHSRRDVAGEKWSYYVKVVDAAGIESSPSNSATSTSLPSVTAGNALATIGSFDRKGTEFKYSPMDYKKIVTAHPDQTIIAGPAATAADVPYLLPGPGDKWAGSKAYTLKWTVNLKQPTAKTALALWLIDTTKLGGILDVTINDFRKQVELPQGATKGSRQGDASGDPTSLRPVAIEFSLPENTLQEGENELVFTLREGGWLAWDALGIFAL
ncbi:MAG: polysaccharide lyase family protein [Corynebacterium sp.]|uniref:polysaccharide lyase family protein n=1 Tax=Corynebacterium sp. TaxID=1720 RepID=UPI0028FDC6F5|nr:polysaccharide lyase family protein [Corynebacterium sp.]MDU2587541.1 polysaccharide lyase family protein [Corynebacterium sp.]